MSARVEDVIAAELHGVTKGETARLTTTRILAALHAAGFVVEQGWQPIETAPRDGTRIIAWFPPCAQLPNGGWHETQWSRGVWFHPFFVEPTHWMPGPKAPAAIAKATGDAR